MIWSSLGALVALWLMFSPALWPETPLRSGIGAAVGLVALAFAALGIAWRPLRRGVVYAGLFLGLVNFFLDGSFGSMTSYVLGGILLIAAGMSPSPQAVAPMIPGEEGRNEVAPEPPPRRPLAVPFPAVSGSGADPARRAPLGPRARVPA
jgi:hypothetical protein